jgi:mRNA interferase HigB
MRIIAYGPLRDFGNIHPKMMPVISAWFKIASSKETIWNKPQDVVTTLGSGRVDILKNNRVCINLGGNNARIILKVEYRYKLVFVRWIGLHKDYDNLGDDIHTI